MKKVLLILLTLIMVFSFAACGSSGDETAEGDLGDFHVAIKDYTLAKDYYDADIMIVKLDFTNNSDEETTFMVTTYIQAYQAGVKLDEAISVDEEVYNSDSSLKGAEPGETIEVEVAFVLNSTDADVEVEASELMNANDQVVTKVFKLSSDKEK